jgi:hypothetical protein
MEVGLSPALRKYEEAKRAPKDGVRALPIHPKAGVVDEYAAVMRAKDELAAYEARQAFAMECARKDDLLVKMEEQRHIQHRQQEVERRLDMKADIEMEHHRKLVVKEAKQKRLLEKQKLMGLKEDQDRLVTMRRDKRYRDKAEECDIEKGMIAADRYAAAHMYDGYREKRRAEKEDYEQFMTTVRDRRMRAVEDMALDVEKAKKDIRTTQNLVAVDDMRRKGCWDSIRQQQDALEEFGKPLAVTARKREEARVEHLERSIATHKAKEDAAYLAKMRHVEEERIALRHGLDDQVVEKKELAHMEIDRHHADAAMMDRALRETTERVEAAKRKRAEHFKGHDADLRVQMAKDRERRKIADMTMTDTERAMNRALIEAYTKLVAAGPVEPVADYDAGWEPSHAPTPRLEKPPVHSSRAPPVPAAVTEPAPSRSSRRSRAGSRAPSVRSVASSRLSHETGFTGMSGMSRASSRSHGTGHVSPVESTRGFVARSRASQHSRVSRDSMFAGPHHHNVMSARSSSLSHSAMEMVSPRRR